MRIKLPAKHKYHAKPTEVNGIRFDSKKEAKYYAGLLLRQRAGEVLYFHRQVVFDLPGNTKYRVDFQEFHTNGDLKYVDVKGAKKNTKAWSDFVRTKKQVEALYLVEIEVV